MKNLIVILSTVAMIAFTDVYGQSCPIPEPLDKVGALGTWEGTYLKDGKIIPLKIRISEKGKTLQTEIAMGKSNFKLAETELCPQEDLHMKITYEGKPIEFRGRPIDGKMAGNYFYKNPENNRVSDIYSLTKQ